MLGLGLIQPFIYAWLTGTEYLYTLIQVAGSCVGYSRSHEKRARLHGDHFICGDSQQIAQSRIESAAENLLQTQMRVQIWNVWGTFLGCIGTAAGGALMMDCLPSNEEVRTYVPGKGKVQLLVLMILSRFTAILP